MLLEIDNVSMQFGGLVALKNVSFGVPAGSIFSIIGPNGAGKTTLFSAISGFQVPASGFVQFDSHVITGLPPYKIARAGVVRTFQKTEVFSELTVFECVRTGLLNTFQPTLVQVLMGSRPVKQFLAGAPDRVADILETVGLRTKSDASAQQLSYGECRLLQIAVALAARPRLLLLDEPFSGLNVNETLELSDLLFTLRSRGITIVLIEHNMNVVMRVSDTIAVLHHGEKIAYGPPTEVSRDQGVVRAYLGREWIADATS
jgi:branched-chain amino acid transport system ATP-binding protein